MQQPGDRNVSTRHGALMVEGEPRFLYGGEIHYFRTDPAGWAARLDAARAAGINVVGSYVPWLWHEPEPGLRDFEGNTHPRRNLLRFLDLCAAADLAVFLRPGPYVMAELRNEGLPDWLFIRHPEVLARTPAGEPHPNGVVSYLHPVFLQLAADWLQAVAEAVRPYLYSHGGPVILWQLDNEVGMLHWVSNQPDRSRPVQEDFARLYGPEPAEPLARHWAWAVHGQDYRARYLEALARVTRSAGVDVPLVVNVHGFRDFSACGRGIDYPIGLAQLALAPRIPGAFLAGDFYPGKVDADNFHDILLSVAFTTALNPPGAPVYSAEFQSGRLSDRPRLAPRDLDLLTRLALAQGLNGLNFYMFSGGDNPEGIGALGPRHEWQAPLASDGSPRPVYAAVRRLGRVLDTFGPDLARAAVVSRIAAGFYPPYYLTDTVLPEVAAHPVLAGIREVRDRYGFDGVYRLLAESDFGLTAVDISRDLPDPGVMPVLWAVVGRYLDAATQLRLAEYVEAGGTLVLGPFLPAFDLEGRPAPVLTGRLQVPPWRELRDPSLVDIAGIPGVRCPLGLGWEEAPGTVLARRPEAGGETAAWVAPRGRGRLAVFGAALTGDYAYHREAVAGVLAALGLKPAVQSGNPAVRAGLRAGPRGRFLSLLNPDHAPQVAAPRTAGWPAGLTVRLEAGGGRLLPLDYPLGNGRFIRYSSAEILELIVREDGWTLTVAGPGTLGIAGDPVTIRTTAAFTAWREGTLSHLAWLADEDQEVTLLVRPGQSSRT